jgi:hypothetical protein
MFFSLYVNTCSRSRTSLHVAVLFWRFQPPDALSMLSRLYRNVNPFRSDLLLLLLLNLTVNRTVARNMFVTCHELAGFLYKHSDEYHILLMSPRWHSLQHAKICLFTKRRAPWQANCHLLQSPLLHSSCGGQVTILVLLF